MLVQNELRQSHRHYIHSNAVLTESHCGRVYRASVRNVSDTGICVILKAYPRSLDQIVEIEIQNPKTGQLILVQGEVISGKPAPTGTQVNVRLLRPTRAKVMALTSLLRSQGVV